MNKMLLVLGVLLLLVPATSLAKPLDTGVVLELLDAGVSDVSIQRYVQRNQFTFDLTAGDLKALKKAGASDSLISFLQDREEGVLSGDQKEQTRPAEGQGEEYDSGSYGVAAYAPYYSFGFSYGYPYYYSDFYYPYYYPYYGYPYYSYGYNYPYYGSGHGGRGSGVVSYWHDGHSGRGGSRPPASASPPPPSRGSSHQGGGRLSSPPPSRGSSHQGGGHGRRR